MEDALGYAILLSPLLLIPALLQRRWSKRRGIAYLGLAAGALTALFSWIDWGGSADHRITQGLVTMYGTAVSLVALAISGLMFMLNPPEPANDADRG